jgi:hypothetical protein
LKKYITNNSLMIAAGAISQNECHWLVDPQKKCNAIDDSLDLMP